MGSGANTDVMVTDNDVIDGSVGGRRLGEVEGKVEVAMEEDTERRNRREEEEEAGKWKSRARLRIWGRTVEGGNGDH